MRGGKEGGGVRGAKRRSAEDNYGILTTVIGNCDGFKERINEALFQPVAFSAHCLLGLAPRLAPFR